MTKEELKEYLDKGVEASKKLFKKGAETSKVYIDKAGKAAQKFGDESVLKIEITQLKSQVKKDKTELGDIVFKQFVNEGKTQVEKDNDEIRFLLDKINQAEEEIRQREAELDESQDKE